MTELKDKVKENHSDGFFEFSFPKKEQSLSIIEYAEKQLKTFDLQPFGSVDSLLLSQVAYMHLDVAVPGVEYDGEAVRIADLYKAEYFDSIFDDVRDAKSNRKLLNAICCSPPSGHYNSHLSSIQTTSFAAIDHQV